MAIAIDNPSREPSEDAPSRLQRSDSAAGCDATIGPSLNGMDNVV